MKGYLTMTNRDAKNFVGWVYNRCLQRANQFNVTLKLESKTQVFGYNTFTVERSLDDKGNFTQDDCDWVDYLRERIDKEILINNYRSSGLDVTAEYK